MFKLSRLNLAKMAEQHDDPQQVRREWLKNEVIAAISQVYDPEIPVNIYDLGLIYGLEVDDGNNVHVRMTLTSPACPVAGSLPGNVEAVVRSIVQVNEVEVELEWDPPWDPSLMSEAARLQLDML
ncbi:MAG: SUF system Fe-S cluster assembly protein [Gammaproteobacteria bacterium]|nr:SUF system Fe-S cluster assembly protein [Gammaproteobacteria bacterium]MBU1723326.1 SUF system Fe-S cluster assembly protein [Gammaproteobacteria bacterium]MBU2006621.1 SUF system Fe-S cluster assembly protein [Gammaproteobacteria bacterium]